MFEWSRTRRTHSPQAACAVVTVLTFLLLFPGCSRARKRPYDQAKLASWQRALNVDSFDTVWTTIHDLHWDPTFGGVDWDAARATYRPRIADDTTLAKARQTMTDMIGQLGSSHFAVIPTAPRRRVGKSYRFNGSDEMLAKVAPAIQDAMQRLDRGDTGIDVRILDDQAVVVDVYPDSPADILGVRPGWIIERVGGKDVADLLERTKRRYADRPARRLALVRAVESRLLGPTGKKVPLVFLDSDDEYVERDVPFGMPRGHKTQYGLLPPLHVWTESKVLDQGIAYFRMNAFLDPPRVMPALEETVTSNLDAPGFVLDLRGNQGGVSAMARGFAGWFIDQENRYLGTVEMRELTLRFAVAPRPVTYHGPLAILVDEVSASTSEILAAGLRDLGRARVFGTATAAAALPSLVRKLPNGDRFQHAVANYVSLGGETLEGSGIIPDEEITVTREALLAGTDPVLVAAQSWIRKQSGLPALEPAPVPAPTHDLPPMKKVERVVPRHDEPEPQVDPVMLDRIVIEPIAIEPTSVESMPIEPNAAEPAPSATTKTIEMMEVVEHATDQPTLANAL